MNALEHTYFALYAHQQGRLVVQHLVQGMEAVDRKASDQPAPRFLSFSDDRDFLCMVLESTVRCQNDTRSVARADAM
jgi:hypothetical protein